jgi:hypothetical protein
MSVAELRNNTSRAIRLDISKEAGRLDVTAVLSFVAHDINARPARVVVKFDLA